MWVLKLVKQREGHELEESRGAQVGQAKGNSFYLASAGTGCLPQAIGKDL